VIQVSSLDSMQVLDESMIHILGGTEQDKVRSHATQNKRLQDNYFWNFPFNTPGPQMVMGNWQHGQEMMEEELLL
jgi:hypothetical protein